MALTNGDLSRIIDRYGDALITDPETRKAWPFVPVGELIVRASRKHLARVHDYPVSLGCALVEGESWFRNIFGCDWDIPNPYKPPYCQIYVTKSRVERLIENYYTPPIGGANGIGYTQLTHMGIVEDAQAAGGAHLPAVQLAIGFEFLADLIELYGYYGGVGAYNAGPGNRYAVRWTYTANLEARHNKWISRLVP